MKVSELIEILKTMPLDAEVLCWDGDSGWVEPDPTFEQEVLKDAFAQSDSEKFYNIVVL